MTKGQIEYQVGQALKETGIKKFTFHNYRNTTLTRWARQGTNVDIAMEASGHTSVQMHKRYVDLQENDIAKTFGTSEQLKMATEMATQERQSL